MACLSSKQWCPRLLGIISGHLHIAVLMLDSDSLGMKLASCGDEAECRHSWAIDGISEGSKPQLYLWNRNSTPRRAQEKNGSEPIQKGDWRVELAMEPKTLPLTLEVTHCLGGDSGLHDSHTLSSLRKTNPYLGRNSSRKLRRVKNQGGREKVAFRDFPITYQCTAIKKTYLGKHNWLGVIHTRS